MGRKQIYMVILAGMTLFFAYMALTYDKLGRVSPSTLCGLPVWGVTLVVIGLAMYKGATWRPVRDPGAFVETPGWLMWSFIGLFFVAIFLGVYYTEPVVCTGKDGDVCYQYGTMYETTRYDGSTYRHSYRNSGIWFLSTDSHCYSGCYAGSGADFSFGGGMFSDMKLDDSDAAILIIVLIVLVIIVLSSAFIPNMWVLASGLCLMCLYLTILRLHNSELADAEAAKPKNDEKPKNEEPVYTRAYDAHPQDGLLADPPDDPNADITA